jgi:hypothetical protein
MTRQEISTFIEKMAELGDTNWTPESVSEAYGDFSLAEALADRKSIIDDFGNIIAAVLNH